MEPRKDDQLIEELRALRPAPRPEFTAELDERAAAGFPRRSRLPWPSFSTPSWSPRRLLLPAGAFAVLAIVVATAVVAMQGSENSERRLLMDQAEPAPQAERAARAPEGAAGEAEEEAAAPEAEAAAGEASTAGGSAGGEVMYATGDELPGRITRDRAIERSARIVLSAEPGDVAEDSAQIFEAVRSHNGIVMRSSTQQGEPGKAGARFELLIPSANLGEALADLSAIDQVLSRREATADITAPTVRTGELLQDSKARIDSLLGQLEEADTESEREAVEAELRQERRHRAALRTQLQNLDRRADLSRVSLRIVTGAPEDRSDEGGAWGIGDALDDAGHILTIAAAVTLVALAVLGPIALIALLAWLTHRAWVRRERRRVLS
jgi:hypothetical protein